MKQPVHNCIIVTIPFRLNIVFDNRMANLGKDDRAEKIQLYLAAAHRCLHDHGCLAVLCDDSNCDLVKSLVSEKLKMNLHHSYYYMSVPYMKVFFPSVFHCHMSLNLVSKLSLLFLQSFCWLPFVTFPIGQTVQELPGHDGQNGYWVQV